MNIKAIWQPKKVQVQEQSPASSGNELLLQRKKINEEEPANYDNDYHDIFFKTKLKLWELKLR